MDRRRRVAAPLDEVVAIAAARLAREGASTDAIARALGIAHRTARHFRVGDRQRALVSVTLDGVHPDGVLDLFAGGGDR